MTQLTMLLSMRNARRDAALAAAALVCLTHAAWAQRTPRVSEVQIVPQEIHIRVGERQPFLATAYDAAGNPVDNATFEWSSSNPDVATIDRGGIVAGVSVGLAIITVRTGTGSEVKSSQAPVQVVAAAAAPVTQAPAVEQQRVAPAAPSVARVTLLPADASLRIGELRPFLPTAYDAAGSAMNGATFQWSSSNPAVASVDQRGVVTGVSAGLAVISSRTGAGDAAKSAEAPVQVGAAAPSAPPAASAPAAAPAENHVDSLRRVCDGGGAAGCNLLGSLYSRGVGVALDLEQARSLYQRGCDGGNADACNNLGVLYDYGRGVPQNMVLAHALFQRSCNAGNMFACFNLGVAYEMGRGVPRDFAQAVTYFRRACDSNNARGCTRLAELYENGRGVRRDHDQARQYFQRGCNGGDLVACTRLQRAK